MPSIASHFACASMVSDIIKINSNEFYFGNILPDLIGDKNSHYKIKGTNYLIPDIIDFFNKTDLTDDILIGYLCHLMLDKYFLEEYVPNNIPNFEKENIFSKNKIYQDYTVLNPKLLSLFKLDLIYLNRILGVNWDNIDDDKLRRNKDSLNKLELSNELNYINFNTYITFLENISNMIAKEIMELMQLPKQKMI